MHKIEALFAREILDSRGRPTLEAACTLAGGCRGIASVPSGASTGTAEALERRDGDPRRYRGLGCRCAVAAVNETIHLALRNRSFASQADLDAALIALDSTPNKSRLGANAILGVSLAFARSVAAARGWALYRHFADMADLTPAWLPRPTINLFSGGKHAGHQAPIQDVLVVPASARNTDEALAMTFAVYMSAADLVARKYGTRLLRADEGGLAPPFANVESMFEDALAAVTEAGLRPGRDVALAVDVAASHFHERGVYHVGPDPLSSEGMIERLVKWAQAYPIVSVEDGLAEDDWGHWPALRQALAPRALVVGDDFLCTQPARIRRAVESRAATALLLKVNQVGTLTEALEARRLAKAAGWNVTVSARSGETEDNWLADLAVGWGGDQIKIGSITQSERLSKYNRLLAVEAETRLPLAPWPGASLRLRPPRSGGGGGCTLRARRRTRPGGSRAKGWA
jgi:enolase